MINQDANVELVVTVQIVIRAMTDGQGGVISNIGL
jgi:hypothetical protein